MKKSTLKFVILFLSLAFVSNTSKAQDAEPEPPATTERAKLPPQFSKLPGKWQFSKALRNTKDLSAEMKMFYINKKPVTLVFEPDGKIIYPAEAEKAIQIKEGYWEYFPDATYNFRIKTIMVDGTADQGYTLFSVSATELIYGDSDFKLKFYFKRVK